MNTAQSPDVLIVPDWPAPPNVRAFVTTRRMPGNSLPPFDAFNLGLRSGEPEDIVRANRALLVRALGLPSSPRWLHQVHGTDVVSFDGPVPANGTAEDPVTSALDESEEPLGDAAIARASGIVLAILTADCLPVLLCADDGSEVAAIHAGWRGLSAGVIERCIGSLRVAPQRLLAWLGPAIGPRSYEVGADVREAFIGPDPAAAGAFEPTRPGHWLCDLYTLARRRLGAAGVTRIHGGGFDTLADPRFYSHRRDGARSGRFASLIHIT